MAGAAPPIGVDAGRVRASVYARAMRRNRIVAILRIALPGLGVVALTLVGLRAVVGTALPEFEFARLSVDRDALTVEAPVFSGIGADGSIYAVRAAVARTAFADPNHLDLSEPLLQLTQLDGIVFNATAAAARIDLATQRVTVEGAMAVDGSSGLAGTLFDSTMYVVDERLVATGGADLVFGVDTTITADAMRYDGAGRLWHFENPIVTLTDLPGPRGEIEEEGED